MIFLVTIKKHLRSNYLPNFVQALDIIIPSELDKAWPKLSGSSDVLAGNLSLARKRRNVDRVFYARSDLVTRRL